MIRLAFVLVLTTPAIAGSLPSTVTLQTSISPSILGHPVTLTAAVTPTAATGPVTFYDGASVVGIGTLFRGQASVTTVLLPAGARSLKAYYAGDANYLSSTSAVFKQTVKALGSTGFQPVVNYNFTTGSIFVTVGDFNGDGRADLVVANPGTETGQVLVMTGIGDGTFKAPVSYQAGNNVNAIAIGDFNGDGRQDLAVVSGSDNSVGVLICKPDGTFLPVVTYGTGQAPDGIAIADFNGDGSPDLAVATSTGVSILLGRGDGTFNPAVSYPAGVAYSVAVADFNNDGRADLVLATASQVVVLLGIGEGSFQKPVNYASGVGGGPVLVGDFNGDGRVDIVAASSNSVSVLPGIGDGTFKQAIVSVSSGPNAFIQTIAAGDIDGDGKLDIIAANSGIPSSTNVSVLLGNGDGTFQTPAYYDDPNVAFATVGDFNGDGVTDIVTAGRGPVGVLLANPAPIVVPPGPMAPTVVPGGVLNSASFAKDSIGHGTAVAPGALVSIFGTFPGAVQASATGVPFLNSLGGVAVTFNGIPAPIRDVVPAANEINVQMPFEVQATGTLASVDVVVTIGTLSSTPVAVPLVPAAPGIFTIPPTGLANAVLVFVDPADNIAKIAAPVSASANIGFPTAPVPRGSNAFFYATGLGAMNPPIADGSGGLESPPVTHYAINPIVMIGGVAANVGFAGQAPGYPGVNQVNVLIPATAPTGDAVPIQIKTSDGSIIGNTATIAIR